MMKIRLKRWKKCEAIKKHHDAGRSVYGIKEEKLVEVKPDGTIVELKQYNKNNKPTSKT